MSMSTQLTPLTCALALRSFITRNASQNPWPSSLPAILPLAPDTQMLHFNPHPVTSLPSAMALRPAQQHPPTTFKPQHPSPLPMSNHVSESPRPPAQRPPPPSLPDPAALQSAAAARAQRDGMPPLTEVERVQRKWQMASIAHFLDVFRGVLPLAQFSEDAAEDLTPSLLERAVAEPELDVDTCVFLRNIIQTLLLTIGLAVKKSLPTTWFELLRMHVSERRADFMDCFEGDENILERYDNGMDFLTNVGWNVRLGLLLSLCDLAAENGDAIREALRQSEIASTSVKSDLDAKGYRLLPIGRCSKKRFHYKVGKTRIYSGYKRKGSGALVVECSDSKSMSELADALDGEGQPMDRALATKIRDSFLAPLLELEERTKKKEERKRLAQIQQEESRRRNAARPRRSKASYL